MPNEKDYSSMSKTELIDHAETLGLSIPVSWTKERIALKIKEKVDKPVNSGTSDFSGDPFSTDEHTDEVRIKKGNEDEERLSKPAAEIAKRIDNKDISYPFFFSFFRTVHNLRAPKN